jgi:hypothetical protein
MLFHWDIVIAAFITALPNLATLIVVLWIKSGQDAIHLLVNSLQTLLIQAVVRAEKATSVAEGKLAAR